MNAEEPRAAAPTPRAVAGRGWLREPLLHFLLIGAVLFLAFEWHGRTGPASTRIVITSGQIDSLTAGFARVWQRPPTEQELKGLLDDYVREEIATREATTMGLERDDTVIRRRLRQKFEFLMDEVADAAPLTDDDLRRWMRKHPDRFQTEPEVAFRQIYLNPQTRGSRVDRDAQVLLQQLAAAGPDRASQGDPTMLPADVKRATRSEIARQFGEAFADRVVAASPGRWSGPMASGFGVHIVYVRERVDGRLPTLDEVRPMVEREVSSERREQLMQRVYDELLSRYRVTVERRTADAGATPGAATGGGQ